MRRVTSILIMLLALPLFAHTTYEGQFKCPLDGKEFSCTMDGSGTSFGKRLDFKPYGPMPAPWRIAQCPQCRFVLFKEEFTGTEIEKLKTIVQSPAYKRSTQMNATYYCLAEIRRQLQESSFEVGFSLLQASWQVESDKLRFNQVTQEAIQAFSGFIANGIKISSRESKDADEEVQPEIVSLYLLVELNRIQGGFTEANKYLRQHDQLKQNVNKGYNDLFNCQKALVEKEDSERRNMGECESCRD